MLRPFDLENQELEDDNPFIYFLQSAAWAIRSTFHTTLQASPYQIVFGRDMIHNVAFKANWDSIRRRKQKLINKLNEKENKSCLPYEYKIGDQVLVATPGILRKLTSHRTGPYPVTQVYNHRTIQINRGPVSEKINIRRLTTYK
jgi:hypothetical protein